ncbi:fumarylacetoacetate hydrolase family protein [Microbacterium sp. TPD7012]|uniref:fumarylacetoacetate hydrolase family protein n=1 Tax=Microbacterium sp. TPD7012 TaxID=2171975 RepID=UPI0014029B4D|nr:fumarylacetoacetate hydrolase family protein [Microbacterium sp. TPD7012]
MKLATFEHDGEILHGVIEGDRIAVAGPGDLRAVIEGAPLERTGQVISVDAVRILAPLTNPGKVVAVAANYQEHVIEGGDRPREKSTATPRLFLKPDTTVVGDDAEVEIASITTQLDWEAELAVVVGHLAKDVSETEALNFVFGYSTSNDISARNLVTGAARDGEAATDFFDWLAGKWLDGSAPFGPYVVTTDEILDPQKLAITLTVNGEPKQLGNTADMIHSVAEIISFTSRLMTLRPGDIILTGTPAGVGMATGTYLNPGDVVVAEIEGLGALTSRIVAPRNRG